MSARESCGDFALAVGIAAGLWMGTNVRTGPLSAATCIIAGLTVFGGARLVGLVTDLAVRALYAAFPSLAPPEEDR